MSRLGYTTGRKIVIGERSEHMAQHDTARGRTGGERRDPPVTAEEYDAWSSGSSSAEVKAMEDAPFWPFLDVPNVWIGPRPVRSGELTGGPRSGARIQRADGAAGVRDDVTGVMKWSMKNEFGDLRSAKERGRLNDVARNLISFLAKKLQGDNETTEGAANGISELITALGIWLRIFYRKNREDVAYPEQGAARSGQVLACFGIYVAICTNYKERFIWPWCPGLLLCDKIARSVVVRASGGIACDDMVGMLQYVGPMVGEFLDDRQELLFESSVE